MRHNGKRSRPDAFFVAIHDTNLTCMYEIVGKGDIVPVEISRAPVMPTLPQISKGKQRSPMYDCLDVLLNRPRNPPVVKMELPPITNLLDGMPIYTIA